MSEEHQARDVLPNRAILAVVTGFVLMVVVGAAVVLGLEIASSEGPVLTDEPGGLPPDVNAIETTVFTAGAQGLELNAAADQRLSRYGWIDREAGVAHLPIEVAFDLYLRRRAEGKR